MDNIVTMDRFGRLVLPRKIREALHVQQPAAFRAEVVGNRVELTPVPTKGTGLIKKRKGLLIVSTGGEKFDAVDVIRAVRGERA